jgi:transcriptional antiterminator RfaH
MSFWGVVQSETFREHIAKRNLERAGFESYLPRIKTEHRIAPLFPSYLFVRIINLWAPIVSTIGVTKLLGQGEQPSRVPDAVVEQIRKQEIGGIVALPQQRRLKFGDKVHVARGNFRGHLGLYAGQAPHERVAVLLELFGRSTRVELPAGDVETAA